MRDLPDRLMAGILPHHQVGVTFINQNHPDKPFYLSFRTASNMSGDNVWSVLEKVIQSNTSFLYQDRFMVYIHHVELPTGEGW